MQPGAARARALGDGSQRAGAGHGGLAAGEGGGVRAGVRGPRLHPAQHPLHLQPLPPTPLHGGHHAGPIVPAGHHPHRVQEGRINNTVFNVAFIQIKHAISAQIPDDSPLSPDNVCSVCRLARLLTRVLTRLIWSQIWILS